MNADRYFAPGQKVININIDNFTPRPDGKPQFPELQAALAARGVDLEQLKKTGRFEGQDGLQVNLTKTDSQGNVIPFEGQKESSFADFFTVVDSSSSQFSSYQSQSSFSQHFQQSSFQTSSRGIQMPAMGDGFFPPGQKVVNINVDNFVPRTDGQIQYPELQAALAARGVDLEELKSTGHWEGPGGFQVNLTKRDPSGKIIPFDSGKVQEKVETSSRGIQMPAMGDGFFPPGQKVVNINVDNFVPRTDGQIQYPELQAALAARGVDLEQLKKTGHWSNENGFEVNLSKRDPHGNLIPFEGA